MKHWPTKPLGNFVARKSGSVDPARFPGEVFDLYSIPAFDSGEPEVRSGNEIGSAKQIVEPGDVLLSRIVPHIRRAWVVGASRGRRLIASGEWIVFRSPEFHPQFLRHFLVSDAFHAQFMQTVSGIGGSLLRAKGTEVAKIGAPLPTLQEQERLLRLLDEAGELRKLRSQAGHRTGEFIPALFDEMFGDPDKNERGWQTSPLGTVIDLLTGFPFKSEEYVDAGDRIRLCRGANVLPQRIDWSDVRHWPTRRVREVEQYGLREGDIILAMDRPWISEGLKIARLTKGDLPCLLEQRVARIRPKPSLVADFVYHVLRHPSFASHCNLVKTETTVPHISPHDIRSFVVPVPPLEMQLAFSDRVTAIRQLEGYQAASRQRLNDLSRAMSHRAFSGEL
jgi:type I restriction enzyme, S subunit